LAGALAEQGLFKAPTAGDGLDFGAISSPEFPLQATQRPLFPMIPPAPFFSLSPMMLAMCAANDVVSHPPLLL